MFLYGKNTQVMSLEIGLGVNLQFSGQIKVTFKNQLYIVNKGINNAVEIRQRI